MSDLDDVVYSELDFWVDKGFIVADELLRELGSVVRNDSRRSVSDVILAVLSDSMVGSWSEAKFDDPVEDLKEPDEYYGESRVSLNDIQTILLIILNMNSILIELIIYMINSSIVGNESIV